jgi:hypothetical protein
VGAAVDSCVDCVTSAEFLDRSYLMARIVLGLFTVVELCVGFWNRNLCQLVSCEGFATSCESIFHPSQFLSDLNSNYLQIS